MDENIVEYSSEERIFSALSHAAIILPYIGLLAPLLIWSSMREKSAWLRFQALQALTYQALQFVFLFLGSCLMMPILFVAMTFDYRSEVTLFFITMTIMFLPYLFWGLLIMLGLLGGMLCAFGKNFKYPIVGRWIQNYLDGKTQTTAAGEYHD